MTLINDEWDLYEDILDENKTETVLDKLLDESGNILLDESGDNLMPESGILENRPTLDIYVQNVNDEWEIREGILNAIKL